MQVCFIIGAMNFSGAEKVLSLVAEGIKNNGHDVSVVLVDKKYGEKEIQKGISTYGVKSTGGKISRIINRWKHIRYVVKEINPDVVVSFGSVCNVNTIPALAGLSYPIVVCERNDPVFDPRKKGERAIRWLLYHFADGYVFQTEKISQYFRKICKNKNTAIIPNPIIDSGIRWDVSKSEKRIVTVARLDNYQKDQITMFKAFDIFHNLHPDYKLEVFGSGPDEGKYREYLSDRGWDDFIRLKGKTNDPISEIRTASIFLLTSKYEGMPNALMEALSIGIPCVSTNCGGGGAEYLMSLCEYPVELAPVGNAEIIAKELSDLVENKELLIRLSEAGLKINTFLEKGKIIKQWTDYLGKVVNKR